MTGRALALVLCAGALAADAAPGKPGGIVRVDHHEPDALPTRGPTTAPVTIELFFAPVQHSRSTAYKVLEQLQAKHPSRIRLVYRIVKGGGASRLHYAALEANAEGKFDAFMNALHETVIKKNTMTLTDAALLDVAKSVGMDVQQLAIVLSNPPPAYDRVLEANERRRRKKTRGAGMPSALFNGRVPHSLLTSVGELEREYLNAKDDADELLDRGADPRKLADAFEAQTAPNPLDIIVPAGNTDETVDDVPSQPPLATPSLDLHGMPSLGPPEAAVTIAVLCNPSSQNCASAMRAARQTQDVYPEVVRVVWAPFFDVSRDDAADLGLLSDAAMCAERVGTSSGDDFESPTSQGWRWVEAMLAETTLRHRRIPADQLLERVTEKLHVDHHAFATCRARQAGTAIGWIEQARHAGVRASPSTVVGGRIYPSITDPNALQQLVEAELAPGDCNGCLHLDDYAPAWRRR